jgi:hypothetical protein
MDTRALLVLAVIVIVGALLGYFLTRKEEPAADGGTGDAENRRRPSGPSDPAAPSGANASLGPSGPKGPLEADRKSYTKYVAKSGTTFLSPVAAQGLECELLVRPAPSTEGEAENMCRGDERCAGYYKSSTGDPVLAMAGPGKCELWWKKLPTADQPNEADVCKKFLGDSRWKTDGEGFCVPECTADRTNTDFLYEVRPGVGEKRYQSR